MGSVQLHQPQEFDQPRLARGPAQPLIKAQRTPDDISHGLPRIKRGIRRLIDDLDPAQQVQPPVAELLWQRLALENGLAL